MKSKAKVLVFITLASLLAGCWYWLSHRAKLQPAAPEYSQTRPEETRQSQAPSTDFDRQAATTKAVAFLQSVREPRDVPESVKSILSPTASLTHRMRVGAVRAIQRPLTSDEIAAFYQYLLTPATSADPTQENWLRNVLLDELVSQDTLPPRLAEVLDAIYTDRVQDDVMRDYAIQHVTPIYEKISAEEKAMLQYDLWQAIEETHTSIAGTALLALERLSRINPDLESERIAETAMRLIQDGQGGELSRITAVQICGRMAVIQAEPVVMALAQNGAQSVPLRIAAISALGGVGSQQVRVYLQQVATGPEARLKPAAETALKLLSERL